MCTNRSHVLQVTRLTQTSAGWESELLRVLHYCGSTIEYLSLWQTESRALLRDSAQVSGRHAQAAWAVGEHLFDEDHPPSQDTQMSDDDIPRWLRDELAQAPAEHVARQHMAHFPFVPRAEPKPRAWSLRPKPRLCTPRFLSLVLYYPFYENERPDLFARMVIWSRVEELDVYIAMEPRKSLHLLACLSHTPTWRLRVSSAHATLAIETTNPLCPNACGILAALVAHRDLEEALLLEMRGSSVSDVEVLELACLRHMASKLGPQLLLQDRSTVAGSATPTTSTGTMGSTCAQDANDIHLLWSLSAAELQRQLKLRICVTQKNQAVWGKLRHRAWDFRERAQFGRSGAWSELLR